MNRIPHFLACMAGGLFLTLSAGAQTATFQLHGTVTHSSYAEFVVGNPVTWTVSLDTTAPVAGSSPGVWAGYYALTQIAFNYNNGEYTGTHTFSSPGSVIVYDSALWDDYIGLNNNTGPFSGSASVITPTFPTVSGTAITWGYDFIRLRATGYSANSNTTLVSPVGQDWFSGDGLDQWILSSGAGAGASVAQGTFHSATAIPEPSTYAALAGLACLAVAVGRRRDAHGLALWRKLIQSAAAFFPPPIP